MVKVWLDDVRLPPADFDVWCTTAYDMIRFLSKHWNQVTVLSLDHDLGESLGTGYDVIKYIEEQVATQGRTPMEIRIHSDNPVGRKNMSMAVDSIQRFSERSQAAN